MCKTIDIYRDRTTFLPRELKNNADSKKKVTPEIEQDILAVSTFYTKETVRYISHLINIFKSTKFYKILCGTTQPAHLIVILSVIFVAVSLYPAREGASTHNSHKTYYKFMYAAATAAHFGSQIWMTFISGLSLYFTLPRHDFGEVQKVLFPIYFAFTALLSAASITSHAQLFGISWTTSLLVVSFLVEILVRVRLCDPLVSLIISKNKEEAKHGLGREVGKLAQDSALFSSPTYAKLHKRFRRLHMIIAMANMTCIGLSTLHIWLSLQECQMC